MSAKEFKAFRLVGGTALSMQRGHRMSADIDLFTDAEYNSINFGEIDVFLNHAFPYVDAGSINIVGMGKSFYVGENSNACIKLDIYYTDQFIEELELTDGIRFAGIKDIIAMKTDVISRMGRKKDFWDIHDLKNDFSFREMLSLHEKRYPYSHNSDQIKNKFTDFAFADEDFDPVCMLGKHWELIKLDIIDFVNGAS
jgi:hypothetical protein